MESKMKVFEKVNLEFFNHDSLYLSLTAENSDSDKNINEELVGIWATYFKLCYYSCVVPFKPVFNPKTSRWQIESSKFQKVS